MRRRYWRSINTLVSIVSGFSKALVVCVCFLTVIRVPTVMSAPASRHNSVDYDERMHSHPKWINPCGLRASDDFDTELEGVPRLNDNELLSSIIVAAKNALMHAQRFKDSYVSTPCINRDCTFPWCRCFVSKCTWAYASLKDDDGERERGLLHRKHVKSLLVFFVRRMIQFSTAQLLVSRGKTVLIIGLHGPSNHRLFCRFRFEFSWLVNRDTTGRP